MNHSCDPKPAPPSADIHVEVSRALAEDVGSGDLTAALIPAAAQAEATVICREAAVLCGTAWFDEAFRQLDSSIEIEWQAHDGGSISPNQLLCGLHGPARAILTGERTALNFLQTLSGTASRARRYAEAVSGTEARILDTRKTLPGLRAAQKYAVRCGGGYNHRMGLYDALLIKENHIAAAGSIPEAVSAARRLFPGKPLEVEVENIDELRQALEAGVTRILLDNFPLEELARAVRINAGRAKLEASGGINLSNIRAVAETGVDFISVGAITKDLQAVDLSLRFSTRRST